MRKFSIVSIICLFFSIGCGSVVTELRWNGFNITQQSFDAIRAESETEMLNKTFVLKNVKVRIVGSKKYFRPGAHPATAGYANTKNEIVILGKVVKFKNGKKRIVINQEILGHELQHLLDWVSLEVANPDKLNESGL